MPSTSKPSTCQVAIEIRWGDAVLGMHVVDPALGFWVGEPAPGRRCDFVVPREVLGQPCWCVVSQDPSGRIVIVAPPGATASCANADPRTAPERGSEQLTLQPGERAVVRVGCLSFHVERFVAERSLARALRRARDWRMASVLALSIAAHALVMGGAAAWSSSFTDPEALRQDQLVLIQKYLQASADRELDRLEAEQQAEERADSRLGGTGNRSKGEESSVTSSRQNPSRPELGAPHVDRFERQAQLRDASSFGMIGLLPAPGEGAADGDPWGRDASVGVDPISARGNMGGDSFGSGGLALSGIGHGGGGRAHSIGLGSGHGRLGGSHRIASPTSGPRSQPQPLRAAAIAPARELPIDPNGRFATTYRPGRGHLAAFESAVARGIFPSATRELVGDIGASHSPELAVPRDKALALEARMERALLPPSGGPTHLRIALRSTPDLPSARPHLSVHLVIDSSGSMEGASIARARDAAHRLVDRLAPSDDFSLVTFSNEAQILVADGPVGTRRQTIRDAIERVRAEGGTNIEQGLRKGYQQATTSGIPRGAIKVVLLLSDGRANAGWTSRDDLSGLSLEAFQGGVQTSTFGLGADYDGELMSAIASDGAGAYYYLRDADQIGPALTTEVDRRLDPAATAVEVRVRLQGDVQLLRAYGSRRLGEREASRVRVAEQAADAQARQRFGIAQDRKDDLQDGMRFFVPAFARDDAHSILLKVVLPGGTSDRRVALVELRYKDRVSGRNVMEEVPVRVGYADSDARSASSTDRSVSRTVQGFLAGETLLAAAQRMELQDSEGAAALLAEREQVLVQAASALAEPSFLTDARRLGRLRAQVGASRPQAEPRALAMLLETAGRSRLQ